MWIIPVIYLHGWRKGDRAKNQILVLASAGLIPEHRDNVDMIQFMVKIHDDDDERRHGRA